MPGRKEEDSVIQNFKAELFKALANPSRIRILELLRAGELTVTELQSELDMEPSSVSQQLGVLRGRQLVVGRKEGTSVYYRVTNPQVFALLDTARSLFELHLGSLQAMADSDPAVGIPGNVIESAENPAV